MNTHQKWTGCFHGGTFWHSQRYNTGLKQAHNVTSVGHEHMLVFLGNLNRQKKSAWKIVNPLSYNFIDQNDKKKIGPWDLCWLKQWYIDQVLKKSFPTCGELTQSNTLCHHVPINQKTPLLQGRQFYQDHCQPIAPSTDNSKSYFTSSQKHKNTRFPILSRFFYCFFTIFNILIIINNLLQNLVWSCRFKCTQN